MKKVESDYLKEMLSTILCYNYDKKSPPYDISAAHDPSAYFVPVLARAMKGEAVRELRAYPPPRKPKLAGGGLCMSAAPANFQHCIFCAP